MLEFSFLGFALDTGVPRKKCLDIFGMLVDSKLTVTHTKPNTPGYSAISYS